MQANRCSQFPFPHRTVEYLTMLPLFLPIDPLFNPCTGVCATSPDTSNVVGAALYSRNNPFAGFVEFTPYANVLLPLGRVRAGAFVSLSAFNGRSRALTVGDWNPYREYNLEVVDWTAEPVIGKEPLFEAFQYRAFLWLDAKGVSFRTGRDYVKVSPSVRYPLFLSGWSYPLDWLYLMRGEVGPFRGYAGFARVPDTVENRRFAFQRMEVLLGPLALAITEAVAYTRTDSWKYANPLVLYYVVQRLETSDNDDNLFLHVDAALNLGNFRIYGEFMGDDPSFFHGEGQAPLWGTTAGLSYLGAFNLYLEASTVAPFTYAHYTGINDLAALGVPLATYLGQDYRAAYLRLERGGLFAEYEYILHGSIPFGLAYENSGLPPDLPFPRPPLSEWHRFGAGAVLDLAKPFGRLDVRGRVGLRVGMDVRNGKVYPAFSFIWGGEGLIAVGTR